MRTKTFGQILVDIGFSELLLLNVLHGDVLSDFLKKVNTSRNREIFLKFIGFGKPEGRYKDNATKLFKKVLRCIGLGSQTIKRYRISGKHVNPFKITGDKLPEIQSLVRSGDSPQIVQWFNEQYKLHLKIDNSGVYKITYKPTGHFYIGSSKNVTARKNNHIYSLKRGTHDNSSLMDLWKQSDNPTEDFIFEILEETSDYLSRERELIEQFRGNPLLLNVIGTFKYLRVSPELKAMVDSYCIERGLDQQAFVEDVLWNYFLSKD